ncbi:hypothetical protein JMA_22540 [Jeotgalibacillus malaysiensis]|uniref:IDEAL domain-containing protein n=1 Tax=Jeotgalibacillus malaysiensis TaxID=1508404 RepID=A0A0B5AN49_9BACL|nr:IDEAL domain-containing protein [Jeotgalibacillus malaysiensis]AJD91571.1 hypothetical protein JMA_22540 [Jeotgalibacillus malaysiensis]
MNDDYRKRLNDAYDAVVYSMMREIILSTVKNPTVGTQPPLKVLPDNPIVSQLERDNLQRLIDTALENGDEESFMKYTEQLKAMVK